MPPMTPTSEEFVRLASAVDGHPTVVQIDGLLASLSTADRDHPAVQRIVDALIDMRLSLAA